MADMMLIPKADLVAGYDAIRAKGVPGLIKSGELAGKIASIQGGAPNGTKWTKSSGYAAQVTSVAYGANTWCAGTEAKGILYSNDNGRTWTKSNITTGRVGAVAYGNGVFVSGAYQKYPARYSTDNGRTWKSSSMAKGLTEKILYGNGIFVMAGANALFYSSDGKTWDTGFSSPSEVFAYLAYADGVFLAGSQGFSGGNDGIYYSIDGKTWSRSDVVTGHPTAMFKSDSLWIALMDDGNAYKSSNGADWSSCTYPGVSESLYYADGLWVAGGLGGVYSSNDNGLTWAKSDLLMDSSGGVMKMDGLWIAAGAGLAYSFDAKEWEKTGVSSGVGVVSVKNSNGMWLAASGNEGGTYYSPTWEPS